MRALRLSILLSGLWCGNLSAQVQPDHVVILVLENHSSGEINGNPLAPYINSILNDPKTAVLTQSYALTHPSQPNYLMLFSGSNQGITTDNVPATFPFTAPNLGAELLQNNFSFAGYSEDLPSVGWNGSSSGTYVRKHNPWVNWQGTGLNGIPAADNLPLTYYPANFDSLPSLSFVIPNEANDMHNGTVTGSIMPGDNWVKAHLDSYIQWCKTHNSLFILTFDEDDNSAGNQILTSITGENVRGGNYSQRITHYNLLRTIEELFRLPYAGVSTDSSVIKDIWLKKELCSNGSTLITAPKTGNTYQWQVNTGAGFSDITNSTYYVGSISRSLSLISVPSSWYGNQYRCMVDGAPSDTLTLIFTDYWNGLGTSTWENALNWSCGLPDENTDVIINSGVSIIYSSPSIRSLKCKLGTKTYVNFGNTLFIKH
jgi:phosphatidylinositol-3-phosphatase